MSSVSNYLRKSIEKAAQEFVRSVFDDMAIGHPDELTSEWLMSIHPELDAEEAELYRMFCKRHTIVFRGCYGHGEIMWPMWQEFKAEIHSL